MALRIDWDNYEVIEAEDFWPWELDYEIEEVRDEMIAGWTRLVRCQMHWKN